MVDSKGLYIEIAPFSRHYFHRKALGKQDRPSVQRREEKRATAERSANNFESDAKLAALIKRRRRMALERL